MQNFLYALKVKKDKETNSVSLIRERTNKGVFFYSTLLVTDSDKVDWIVCTEEFVRANIEKIINADIDISNRIYYVKNKLGVNLEKEDIKKALIKKYARLEEVKKEFNKLNKEIEILSSEWHKFNKVYKHFRDCIIVGEDNGMVYLEIKEDVDPEILKTLPGFCGDERKFIYDCEVYGDNLMDYSLTVLYNYKDKKIIKWGNENTICSEDIKQLVNYVLSFMARRVRRRIVLPNF